MLFRQPFLEGIRDGSVTLAFRWWRRPSVKTGGTLLAAVGQLSIASVSPVSPDEISQADARKAGYPSLDALLAELGKGRDGGLYRIELGPLRADPRVALRESLARTDDEHSRVRDRLAKLDARSPDGPWTLRTLEVIRARPGTRAGDICRLVGQERDHFKQNVRKLKGMGMTESLEVGYRLLPRGAQFVQAVQARTKDGHDDDRAVARALEVRVGVMESLAP